MKYNLKPPKGFTRVIGNPVIFGGDIIGSVSDNKVTVRPFIVAVPCKEGLWSVFQNYRLEVVVLDMLDPTRDLPGYTHDFYREIEVERIIQSAPGQYNAYFKRIVGNALLSSDIDAVVAEIEYNDADDKCLFGGGDIHPDRYILVDSEIMQISSIDRSYDKKTGTIVVVRGQRGTVAASHSSSSVIEGYALLPPEQRGAIIENSVYPKVEIRNSGGAWDGGPWNVISVDNTNCFIKYDDTMGSAHGDEIPSDADAYIYRNVQLERWVSITIILGTSTATPNIRYGPVTDRGVAMPPTMSDLEENEILLADVLLSGYQNKIYIDKIDFSRRENMSDIRSDVNFIYPIDLMESQGVIPFIDNHISAVNSGYYTDAFFLKRTKDFSNRTACGMGEQAIYEGDDYLLLNKYMPTPASNTPPTRGGNKIGQLSYVEYSGNKYFAMEGTTESGCTTTDWRVANLNESCSDACMVHCEAVCQSSCQCDCQTGCDCGAEHPSDCTNYQCGSDTSGLTPEEDPHCIGPSCHDCDTSADMQCAVGVDAYCYETCPVAIDIEIPWCKSQCEGTPACPTEYQNPCTVACETSCDCSCEVNGDPSGVRCGVSCESCDLGSEDSCGASEWPDAECSTSCEHCQNCESGDSSNCDCFCDTTAMNSCQLAAQSPCSACDLGESGGCDTDTPPCSSCDTSSDTGCVALTSANILWDGNTPQAGELKTFNSNYSPSDADAVSYSWSTNGEIVGDAHSGSVTIRWNSQTTGTVTVTVSNACSSVDKTITINNAGQCCSASINGVSGKTNSACPNTNYWYTAQVSDNSCVQSYSWSINVISGGGTASIISGQGSDSVKVSFSKGGVYDVKCNIVDKCGASSNGKARVSVTESIKDAGNVVISWGSDGYVSGSMRCWDVNISIPVGSQYIDECVFYVQADQVGYYNSSESYGPPCGGHRACVPNVEDDYTVTVYVIVKDVCGNTKRSNTIDVYYIPGESSGDGKL